MRPYHGLPGLEVMVGAVCPQEVAMSRASWAGDFWSGLFDPKGWPDHGFPGLCFFWSGLLGRKRWPDHGPPGLGIFGQGCMAQEMARSWAYWAVDFFCSGLFGSNRSWPGHWPPGLGICSRGRLPPKYSQIIDPTGLSIVLFENVSHQEMARSVTSWAGDVRSGPFSVGI